MTTEKQKVIEERWKKIEEASKQGKPLSYEILSKPFWLVDFDKEGDMREEFDTKGEAIAELRRRLKGITNNTKIIKVKRFHYLISRDYKNPIMGYKIPKLKYYWFICEGWKNDY